MNGNSYSMVGGNDLAGDANPYQDLIDRLKRSHVAFVIRPANWQHGYKAVVYFWAPVHEQRHLFNQSEKLIASEFRKSGQYFMSTDALANGDQMDIENAVFSLFRYDGEENSKYIQSLSDFSNYWSPEMITRRRLSIEIGVEPTEQRRTLSL